MTNGKEDGNGEDEKLWRFVTQTVTPLDGRSVPPGLPEQKKYDVRKTTKYVQDLTPKSVAASPPGREVDHRTAERLRRGVMDIDVRIDLHGMNREQAFEHLVRALPAARDHGKRVVLIVTGKGNRGTDDKNAERGVLRRLVPEWLSEPPLRDIVLQSRTAQPRHGGDGALYVLLRRKR